MRNFFKHHSMRMSWMVVLGALVAAALVRGRGDEVQAQFRLPKVPNLPNVPNIGGSGSRGGNQQDVKNFQEMGQKGLELLDLENQGRQQELGQSIALSISNRHAVSKDRSLNEYVNLVGLTVAAVSPRPDISYAFGVLESNEVGAYSTPGGYVFVTRGALNIIEDESELAGVLAHEVAHVVLNHGIEAVKSAKRKQIADTFVQKYGQKLGALAQFADEGTQFVLVSGYSQIQERDADAKAVEWLILARYDPRGFARFLTRLDQQNRTPANVRKQMFSTHPGTAERIGNVSRQIASSKFTGGATVRARFLANVRPGRP
jgi:beta-barrel assembly-enhancing protease